LPCQRQHRQQLAFSHCLFTCIVHMEGARSWKKKRKKIGSDVPDAGRAAGCGAAEACGRGGRVKRTVTSESIDAELLTVGNSGGSGVGEVI
jgi:hypothetical protein